MADYEKYTEESKFVRAKEIETKQSYHKIQRALREKKNYNTIVNKLNEKNHRSVSKENRNVNY
jgi:hypothetical protein